MTIDASIQAFNPNSANDRLIVQALIRPQEFIAPEHQAVLLERLHEITLAKQGSPSLLLFPIPVNTAQATYGCIVFYEQGMEVLTEELAYTEEGAKQFLRLLRRKPVLTPEYQEAVKLFRVNLKDRWPREYRIILDYFLMHSAYWGKKDQALPL